MPRGIADGLASPSASRPFVSRAGLRACECSSFLRPHLPVPLGTVVYRGLGLAYRCVGSAGIALVFRVLTGFPFHPGGAGSAPGTPETLGTLRGCPRRRNHPVAPSRALPCAGGPHPRYALDGDRRRVDRPVPVSVLASVRRSETTPSRVCHPAGPPPEVVLSL